MAYYLILALIAAFLIVFFALRLVPGIIRTRRRWSDLQDFSDQWQRIDSIRSSEVHSYGAGRFGGAYFRVLEFWVSNRGIRIQRGVLRFSTISIPWESIQIAEVLVISPTAQNKRGHRGIRLILSGVESHLFLAPWLEELDEFVPNTVGISKAVDHQIGAI